MANEMRPTTQSLPSSRFKPALFAGLSSDPMAWRDRWKKLAARRYEQLREAKEGDLANRREQARAHFAGLAILRGDEDAVSLGVESAGKWQTRGNGNLALTAEELCFA